MPRLQQPITDPDFILEEMTALHPDGARSIVHVRIGKSMRDDGGSYVCVIEAPGIHKPIGIHGEGPMQSPHLA